MAWVIGLTLVVLCWTSAGSANFTDLDGNTLHTLDQYVRQDMAFRILFKLNETIQEQNRLSSMCHSKINRTVTSCRACASSHTCNSQLNVNVTMGKILPFVYRPVLAISSVIDGITGTLGGLLNILGNLGGSFLGDLGNLAGSAGNSLIQLSLAKFNLVGNGLLSLSTGFGQAASNLLQGAGSVVNTLGAGTGGLLSSFGQGAGNALDQLGQGAGIALNQFGQGAGSALNQLGQGAGSALSQLGQGAGSTLDQLSHGASSSLTGLASGVGSLGSGLLSGLGHLTSGASDLFTQIFGRRATAPVLSLCSASECPVCNQLDTSKYEDHDIVVAVCGPEMVENQTISLTNIAHLEKLYNVTLMSSIVNTIQFDPTTLQTSGGVSFTSAFATLSIPDKTILTSIPSGLKLSDLKSTAQQIVQEVWDRAEMT